ncbi:hypothetical protein PI124_g17636 [Phytophthora idaei]|nr:hypothetical protein PI125_g18251 [Phytophthora idaei]KAG3136279.1 hypothetical protein PI126_g17882 [Phytophthora idaei]KAG3237374.1 hypothetical protein PI124_g17636 [Phytophthora idaei]
MAGGRLVQCDKEVVLDLELSTSAGLVSMRSVTCLVLAGDGDEFSLGSDALKALGIDVEHQVAQLAGQPALVEEEDEFPVGDAIPGEEDPQDAVPEVEQLMVHALAKGMPAEYAEPIREILAEFPDVWRVTISPDPPARVEPFEVTLRSVAVPYRSPPRKYAPLQAQFI